METGVRACIEDAFERLRRGGFELVDVDVPALDLADEAIGTIVVREAYDVHRDLLEREGAGYGTGTRAVIEAGRDVDAEVFTAVGIGDMSGDVFGNGMLLSSRIKLVAAFDHRHLVIDPDPDPALSFAERKRLFELPGSSWDDYDRALISAGGGVWARSEKRIPLSPEARVALGVEAETLTPNEVYAFREAGSPRDGPGWRLRVVPNRYPAVRPDGFTNSHKPGGLFDCFPGLGRHEVVIESAEHVSDPTRLDDGQFHKVFLAYRERILAHSADAELHYAAVFKNVGAEAGASLGHSCPPSARMRSSSATRIPASTTAIISAGS